MFFVKRKALLTVAVFRLSSLFSRRFGGLTLGFAAGVFCIQVGAPLCRQLFRLFKPPGVNIGVVTAEQYLGHLSAHKLNGARILRIFQKIVLKAFRFMANGVGQNSVAQPAYAVAEDTGGYFPSRQHIVTDGDFLVHNFVDYALVDALVMTAKYDETVVRSKTVRRFVVKHLPAGGHIDHMYILPLASVGGDGAEAVVNGGSCHKHTLPAAAGGVVYAVTLVVRVVADIVYIYFKVSRTTKWMSMV